MLLQERSPFCMLPAPLNIFPALIAPFHFMRIYHAQSEGRKIKKQEINEAKKEAIRVHSVAYQSDSSVPNSPAQTPTPTPRTSRSITVKLPQMYVTSLAGSLSDDIIKYIEYLFLALL